MGEGTAIWETFILFIVDVLNGVRTKVNRNEY